MTKHRPSNPTNSRELMLRRRSALKHLALIAGSAAAFSIPGLAPRRLFAQSEPVVATQYGRVRGVLNGDVYAFKGLRYGADTGGPNRFKAPANPQPWTGIRDAVAYGNSAPQTNPDAANPGGVRGTDALRQATVVQTEPPESEDCLFLNVWTAGVNDGRKRPVMVWLHGGAFVSGSGSSPTNDGTNLVRRGDVVVVTINHRLNAFGFSHFGDIAGPEYARSGNAGMLDIIAALAWIRDNIERFGGDPQRVMIFGESGGGQKVSMLMGSPPAKGLFSRAIIESGSGPKMLERDRASEIAEVLLRELGLNARRLPDIHRLPMAAILGAYFTTLPKVGGIRAGFIDNFAPVLDPDILPAHPFHPQASPIAADVPLVIGWNRTEMTLFAMSDPSVFTIDETEMRRRVTEIHGGRADAVLETYQRAYPSLSPVDRFLLIWSDYPTMIFSNRIAERRAALNRAPSYLYRFDWQTPVMDGKLRTPHTLEIPFVFDNVTVVPGLTGGGANAIALAARMSEAWIEFAATGNPNTARSGLPDWQPYKVPDRPTLVLDNASYLAFDPQRPERELLDDIVNASG